jgi:drug/metabolite transporter (DMT)-like permease
MLWMVATGLQFCLMNALLKKVTHELEPWVVGWLRYSLGAAVMLPAAIRARALWPRRPGLQLLRGGFHGAGLMLWFVALPTISLAEMTAIGFSGPIFICLGAVLVLGERMGPARWAAVLAGFCGVLLIVRPWEGGLGAISTGTLLLLAATPVFSAGFLVAKVQTRHERLETIVLWQHLWVGVLMAPLALARWAPPTQEQWLLLVVTGFLGAGGHYCSTRAFRAADISAVQSVRFLDLVWASLLGVAIFGTVPEGWTVAGGVVILLSTLWLARREARGT